MNRPSIATLSPNYGRIPLDPNSDDLTVNDAAPVTSANLGPPGSTLPGAG
jgi:hypothetical protein